MTDYYVDQAKYRASDGNSGTSLSSPLLTLARANALANSGDTVSIKAGTYRETVALRSDGVTWQALEPGVVVRGSRTVTGPWTDAGGGVWTTSYAPPTGVQPLVANAGVVLLVPALDAGSIVAGTFWYASGVLSVNTGLGNPGSVEVAERACFTLTNRDSVLLRGIEFTGANAYSMRIQGGGNHVVRHCRASYSGTGGFRIEPVSPQLFTPTDAGATTPGLSAGTYAYLVTAIIGGVETLPSFELTITVAAGHGVGLQWSNVTGATGYRIYGRVKGSETLMRDGVLADFPLVGGFPTWTDDGSVTPGATPVPTSSSISVNPCLIESSEVMMINSHGVYLYGAVGCTIRGCRCHHNKLHGIGLLNGSNNNTVELNACYSNANVRSRLANGIQCDSFGGATPGSSGNIIQRNSCFRNEDSGISVYNGSHDCIVRRNVCYLNGDHGIDNFASTGCVMTNNTCVGNVTAGLNSESASTGVRMFNNVSVDNGIASPRTTSNYRVDTTTSADAQVDYNLSYLSRPPTGIDGEFTWGTTTYATLAAFRVAHPGQMAHGASADPQFDSASASSGAGASVLGPGLLFLAWSNVVGSVQVSVYYYRLGPSSPGRGLASTSAAGYHADSIEGAAAGATAGAYA